MVGARQTVTADWYVRTCLTKVFSAVSKMRPNSGLRGIKLHHDNAPAHTARRTENFLKKKNVKLVGHPAYSPDLAPCDFWLNPTVKLPLRGQRFRNENEVKIALETAIKSLNKADFSNCFDSWFNRMRQCVDARGAYFE